MYSSYVGEKEFNKRDIKMISKYGLANRIINNGKCGVSSCDYCPMPSQIRVDHKPYNCMLRIARKWANKYLKRYNKIKAILK